MQTLNKNKSKRILLLLILIPISIIVLVNWQEVISFIKEIEMTSAGKPLITAFVLIGLNAILAPLGFPGTPLTLLAGSLLGVFWGTITAITGNMVGASLAFLLSRYILKNYVQEKILSKHQQIIKYQERLKKRSMPTVIALRLIPLFPFNALNFLLGIVNISFKNYFLGTLIGIIPGTTLFVYFGGSIRMLSIPNIVFSVLGIVLLTYLGKKYQKKI